MVEVPHTLDAVRVGQHFANRLVDTARYSSHGPASHEQELADLIYSTAPVFSARFEVRGEAGPWCWCGVDLTPRKAQGHPCTHHTRPRPLPSPPPQTMAEDNYDGPYMVRGGDKAGNETAVVWGHFHTLCCSLHDGLDSFRCPTFFTPLCQEPKHNRPPSPMLSTPTPQTYYFDEVRWMLDRERGGGGQAMDGLSALASTKLDTPPHTRTHSTRWHHPQKTKPPSGPDDDEHEGGGDPDRKA
jgi:hypothetical protein